MERYGTKVPRPRGVGTPCSYCPKQPDDIPERERTPSTAIELSEQNTLAYIHYLECRAVSDFPKDDIVRRNAAIIREAQLAAERIERIKLSLIARPFRKEV